MDSVSSSTSDGSYPKDEGSSQEVKQSLFVGESRNRGNNGGQNKYWGPGGVDGKFRTLPRNRYVIIKYFKRQTEELHSFGLWDNMLKEFKRNRGE